MGTKGTQVDKRVTYRRRNPYNTKSNYFRKVRTPGNRLVVHYLKKLQLKHRSVPKCRMTGKPLPGCIPNRGNYKNRRLTARQKKRKPVNRAYGGNLCYSVVRLKIIRAFLNEECRIASKYRKFRKRMSVQRAKTRISRTDKGKKSDKKQKKKSPKKEKKEKRGKRDSPKKETKGKKEKKRKTKTRK